MDAHEIRTVWLERRQRYSRSRAEAERVRAVLKGDYGPSFRDLVPEGEEPVVANLIRAASRQLMQRIGHMPKIHATPPRSNRLWKARAERHEAALQRRLEDMVFEMTMRQAGIWLAVHGFVPFTLRHDNRDGRAVIDVRDPVGCYPNTVWPHRAEAPDCLFAVELPPHQIKIMYPDAGALIDHHESERGTVRTVTVGEYHTPEGIYVTLLEPGALALDFIPNPLGRPTVWIARDVSEDFDFSGAFDQLVPVLFAQAKLFALLMAYAEDQVFAETVVIGEITSNQGKWARGPGGVNTIQPAPNAAVQKLTNNASVQVFSELDRLERAIRLGGMFPPALSGEPVASVATGRGVESLLQGVDTNVAHYQAILSFALRGVFNTLPDFERAWGVTDHEWVEGVRIYPRFQLGADPGTNVMLLQRHGAGILSRQTVMDQDPNIDDPHEEMARVQTEQLNDALLAQLQSQAAQGALPPRIVIGLTKKLEQRVTIAEAYDDLLREEEKRMAEEAAAQQPDMAALAAGAETQMEAPPLQALLSTNAAGAPRGGITGSVPVGPPAGR